MQRVKSLPSSWQRQRTIFLVTPLVVAADQLSKLWVRHSLLPGESLPSEGVFRLTHVRNEGIVFGLSAPPTLSLVLSILLLIAVCFLYFRYAPPNLGSIKVGIGLLVGGDLGNLIDRFRFGYVTDFIDIRLWGNFHWPVFNVADMAEVIGVILIVYSLLRLINSPKRADGNSQNHSSCS